MTTRPLPRSFDAIVVFIATQAHLASLLFVLRFADHYRSAALSLALLGCSLVVPLACVVVARRRGGGDLSSLAFVAVAGCLLAIDVALALTMRPEYVGAPSMWTSVAIGVTLLTLCPYWPPRDLMVLAVAHAGVIAAVLALHRGQPTVEPFAVVVHLSGAIVPALAAAEFVRFYVRALRRRQDAVAEQARAQAEVAAAAAIQADADARLAQLRTEVLPLLSDVAAHRRPVDDPEGARLAGRLSAELRRELVEARAGAWLLNAPVTALAGATSSGSTGSSGGGGATGDGWPGIVLLDPQRLVGRLAGRDRAALSAVLAAVRATGAWASVSVALSVAYPVSDPVRDLAADALTDPDGERGGPGVRGGRGRRGRHGEPDGRPRVATSGTDDAFVTVVAHATGPLTAVDPAVMAAAERAGCIASLEPPAACVIEGTCGLQPLDAA